MSIQRYSIHHSGKRCVISETGDFVDWEDHCESVEILQSEIDRLTRELAEAKALAVVDTSMVRRALHYCPLDLPSPKKWEWMAKHITQALSARPEFPKEPSDVE